jgi:hypothetical protein
VPAGRELRAEPERVRREGRVTPRRPGPFTEALNAIEVFGRKTFLGGNKGEWIVDLTPYLADKPARTAYLAISDADPKDGFGAAISRVEVAVLDEAETARWSVASVRSRGT